MGIATSRLTSTALDDVGCDRYLCIRIPARRCGISAETARRDRAVRDGEYLQRCQYMHIRHVTISVPDPAETARFLTSLFGFPLDHAHRGESLRLGTSRLSLVEGSMEPNGFYHLAFEIPENTVYAARDLLAARIPILDAGDNGIVAGSPAWDSHSVYFNAPGNLNLELIGRHRLPNAITSPFSLSDILRISEVGVPVENPLVAA